MKLDHSTKVLDDAKKAIGPLDKPVEEGAEAKKEEAAKKWRKSWLSFGQSKK